jgi:hypothetical protein
VRYLTCLSCGLKVKTEERLAVPWDERDFMALVAQVFPEDTIINVAIMKAQGLLGDGLSQLNAHLVPHSWQLEPVRDQGLVVGIVRRRMSSEVLGGTNAVLEGKIARAQKRRVLSQAKEDGQGRAQEARRVLN